jgi:CHAP domain
MQSLERRVVPYGRPRRSRRQRIRIRRSLFVISLALVAALLILDPKLVGLGHSGPSLTPLQNRIVSIAESQLGYRTDPADTYCNRYSAYWYSGAADCGNSNRDEEWCADFAAWVWHEAGVSFTYQFINGDINSSSASFYEWGVAHGTWHPYRSTYQPQPGDVAVYGLDVAALTAAHVAVVTSFSPGERGPDVVNGDGDRTGFSVVEAGTDQFFADTGTHQARISGYVSP